MAEAETIAVDARLTEAHYSWLKTVKGACDTGVVWLVEGGYPLSENIFTIDQELYSQEERVAIGDLIRWGYFKWTGFIAGDLGCEITDTGRGQLARENTK